MAVEGPYIAAIVARMHNPEGNLAAYGVAFAIGLLVEAPVIMMMAAAARLVKGKDSYKKLLKFNLVLSLACTAFMLFILIPPIFKFWTAQILGLSEVLQAYVHHALICLLAWPGMIGIRRFYQGILIANKNNKRVAIGTLIRLAAMSVIAFSGYKWGSMNGASVGTLALSAGVTAEAAFIYLVARERIQTLKGTEESPHETLKFSIYHKVLLSTGDDGTYRDDGTTYGDLCHGQGFIPTRISSGSPRSQ